MPGFTDVQVGSYVFMDMQYLAIGREDGEPVYDDFASSLTVVGTVLNNRFPGKLTIDAGAKALTLNVPHAGVIGEPGADYNAGSDEFGVITFKTGSVALLRDGRPHRDDRAALRSRGEPLRRDVRHPQGPRRAGDSRHGARQVAVASACRRSARGTRMRPPSSLELCHRSPSGWTTRRVTALRRSRWATWSSSKGVYEAFGRGDIAAVLGAMDPAIEWRQAEGNPYRPSGEPWIGPDAVLNNLFMRIGTDWDGFKVTSEAFHDAGETVVVELRYTGHFKATGKDAGTGQACHIWRRARRSHRQLPAVCRHGQNAGRDGRQGDGVIG